jgi:predicted aspartyl protease
MNCLRIVAAALLALTVDAAPALATNCSADVPMRFYGTSPAVEVEVNRSGKFLFLIDTGAQGIARADLSLVTKLALKSVGKQEIDDGTSATSLVVDKYVLDEIRLGDMVVTGAPASARDYNRTPFLADIAGILGFGFFKDCLLTLDYKRKRVRVTSGALAKANGRDVLPFRDDGGPFVPLSLGAFRTEALIDTGSQLGLLLPVPMVKNLPLASYRRTVGKAKTVTNEADLSEVMIQDTLAIGAYRVEKPVINFSELFRDVVLGSAALQELTLSFDQKNKRVRIRRGGR